MTDSCPQMSGEELLIYAEELGLYTFLFTEWDEANSRWIPNVWQSRFKSSLDVATGQFWLNRDPARTKLSAVLPGTVATVDEAAFADEPVFDRQWLDEYTASAAERQWFTVYAVWKGKTDPEFVRHCKYVEAVDWIHAILLARKQARGGEFLNCGVVELRVQPLDGQEGVVYATPTGTLPE